jgi:hypothetical protein
MPTTRIIIGRDGKVYIEGIGYAGQECLKDLEKILIALRALGINVNIENIQLKQEAHRQRVASHG